MIHRASYRRRRRRSKVKCFFRYFDDNQNESFLFVLLIRLSVRQMSLVADRHLNFGTTDDNVRSVSSNIASPFDLYSNLKRQTHHLFQQSSSTQSVLCLMFFTIVDQFFYRDLWRRNMAFDQTTHLMSSESIFHQFSSSIDAIITLKYTFESIICLLTIFINILLVVALIQLKNDHPSQNLLLINVSSSCILFSLSCLFSISLSLNFVWRKVFDVVLCKFVGFLLIISCHCLMFSYTSVALLRFLSIIYPFNRKLMTIQHIKIYLILSWTFALFVSILSLILPTEHIKFQSKAKVCFLNQQSPILLLYFCTGFIFPIIFISLMNFITYLHVKRSRQTTNSSSSTENRLQRFNKRKRRNLRLLRQFSFFTIFFLLGWTPFIIIELFDRDEKLSDSIYLSSLILPPICVLIDSCAILIWHKAVHNSIRTYVFKCIRTNETHRVEREKSSIENDSYSINTTGTS